MDGCATEETTIAISVEDSPQANDDAFEVDYETTLEFGSLLNNDVFNDDLGVTVSIMDTPSNGVAIINGQGTLTYIPSAGFIGQEIFTYEICSNCNGDLCSTAQITINVEFDGDCEVPTVISPNEDGVNDVIFINCLASGEFPNNSFAVYNQWGDQVFSASPYGNDWDGTYEGDPLPDGTYFYIFKETENSDPDKGYITITR